MSRKHASDHLAAVPLFSACSQKELNRIASASVPLTFADGHVLMTQDETSREAFVITSGTVSIKRNNRKVADLGPGSVLGELGLLDKGPRTATAIADGPVEALVLGPREFAALLVDVPTMASKLLKALAAKVRELDSKTFG